MMFTLTIETGNVGMQRPFQVGDALRGLAERLESISNAGTSLSSADGPVVDANGNKVGRWAGEWPVEDGE